MPCEQLHNINKARQEHTKIILHLECRHLVKFTGFRGSIQDEHAQFGTRDLSKGGETIACGQMNR